MGGVEEGELAAASGDVNKGITCLEFDGIAAELQHATQRRHIGLSFTC